MGLIKEERDYPKELQELAKRVRAGTGREARDWILKVLDQGTRLENWVRESLLIWEHPPKIQNLSFCQGPQEMVQICY